MCACFHTARMRGEDHETGGAKDTRAHDLVFPLIGNEKKTRSVQISVNLTDGHPVLPEIETGFLHNMDPTERGSINQLYCTVQPSCICPRGRTSSNVTHKWPETLRSLLGDLFLFLMPNQGLKLGVSRTMDIPVSRVKDALAAATRAPAKEVDTKALHTPTPGSHATGEKRNTEPVGLHVISNDRHHKDYRAAPKRPTNNSKLHRCNTTARGHSKA